MSEQESGNELRGSSLQSFVISRTGLEAFANTYFHIGGNELGSAAIVQMPEIILAASDTTELHSPCRSSLPSIGSQETTINCSKSFSWANRGLNVNRKYSRTDIRRRKKRRRWALAHEDEIATRLSTQVNLRLPENISETRGSNRLTIGRICRLYCLLSDRYTRLEYNYWRLGFVRSSFVDGNCLAAVTAAGLPVYALRHRRGSMFTGSRRSGFGQNASRLS